MYPNSEKQNRISLPDAKHIKWKSNKYDEDIVNAEM